MPIKQTPKQEHSDATTRECRKLLDASMATVDGEIQDYKQRLRNEAYLTQTQKDDLKQKRCENCDGLQLNKNESCEACGIKF